MSASILSIRRFRLIFISWWLLWAALQTIVLNWFGLSWRLAFADSIIANICTASGCLLVSYIMQFYLPQKERYWYIFTLSIFLSLITTFISKGILCAIYTSEFVYLALVQKSLPVRGGIAFLLIACMSMISMLWYTFIEKNATDERRADAEKLSREAELFKLRQQLQPHFLFNSLNSISALVGSRPEEARHMIQQLSDFLRGTIKREDNQTVTLAEELQQLQLYLDIEKVRFGHRLTTTIATTEECLMLKVPSLLLQPIVENAIKFGLYDTTGKVIITLQTVKENSQLIITITNPFDAQTSPPQRGTGFGVSSVKRRLYLLFARTDLLTTSIIENTFITTIKIPQHS